MVAQQQAAGDAGSRRDGYLRHLHFSLEKGVSVQILTKIRDDSKKFYQLGCDGWGCIFPEFL